MKNCGSRADLLFLVFDGITDNKLIIPYAAEREVIRKTKKKITKSKWYSSSRLLVCLSVLALFLCGMIIV